jgi:ELWxxDGT repeat protein
VGAWKDDVGAVSDAGSAYLFKWDGAQWVEQTHFMPSTPQSGDNFGSRVAISGDRAIVSASHLASAGVDPDSVYLLDWSPQSAVISNPANFTLDYLSNASGTADITIRATDTEGLSVEQTFTVTLNPVNDAPVLFANGAFALQGTENVRNPPGESVADIIAGTITDVDAGALQGIAVTAFSGEGTWQYSTNDGASWTAFGEVSSTSATLLKALDATKIRFVPATGWSGTASISYNAWDQTDGRPDGSTGVTLTYGAGGAYSQANVKANYSVLPDPTTPVTNFQYSSQIEIVPNSAHYSDSFGRSVDISGEWAIAGSPGYDGNAANQGAVYFLRQNQGGPDKWGVFGSPLTATDATIEDQYGVSVSIDGDWAIVGAYRHDVSGRADQGEAYILHFDSGANQWIEVTRITADDGAAGDYFGYSVSISGDYAIVGAYQHDVRGRADQGAAYIFYRNQDGADQWGQVAEINSNDGAAADYFGYSVSISGEYALVGAYQHDVSGRSNQGAAYVFQQDLGGSDMWGQVKELNGSGPAADDQFGYAVSISGDTALVGARYSDYTGSNSGAAYIFYADRGGANAWGEVKRMGSSTESSSYFGSSVNLEGDYAIVGRPYVRYSDLYTGANATEAGNATIFVRNEGGADNWGSPRTLTQSDHIAYTHFGSSVAISADAAMAGISPTYGDTGAVYVYTPVNCRPKLDYSGDMSLTPISEEDFDNPGNSVAEIIASAGGDRITDADPGALEGMSIVVDPGASGGTALEQVHGHWEFRLAGQSTWSPFDPPTNCDYLLLGAEDYVRFVPDGVTGASASFAFQAWDQSSGTRGSYVDVYYDPTGQSYDRPLSGDYERVSAVVVEVDDPEITVPACQPIVYDWSETFEDVRVVGDRLFFRGSAPGSSADLWQSTGNQGEIWPESNTVLGDLNILNGLLVYQGDYYDPVSGDYLRGLFATDGTNWSKLDAVVDGSGNPADFSHGLQVVMDGVLYMCDFAYYWGTWEGLEGQLWASDGTPGGAYKVADVPSETDMQLVAADGKIYFAARETWQAGDGNYSLWVSDGSAGGTHEVSNSPADVTGYWDAQWLTLNDGVYFTTYTADGAYQLYWSNGTDAQPVLDENSNPMLLSPWREVAEYSGANIFEEMMQTTSNGSYFFAGRSASSGPAPTDYGTELYVVDNVTHTAHLVADILNGPDSGVTDPNFITVDNILYFQASDGVNGNELWRTDGTPDGTYMVKNIGPGASDGVSAETASVDRERPIEFVALNNILYFMADDGVHGSELWRSDGTEAGTYMVKDMEPGAGDSAWSDAYAADDAIFFRGWDSTHGWELWRSDGTPEGTLCHDLNPGTADSTPDNFIMMGDALYFRADHPYYGTQIWKNTLLYPAEDQPITFGSALQMSDPDAGSDPIQVTITVTHGSVTLDMSAFDFSFTDAFGAGDSDFSDGVICFRGTVPDINAALAGLVFTPELNYSGTSSVTLVAEDMVPTPFGYGRDEGTVYINTTPSQDAPSATNLNQGVDFHPISYSSDQITPRNLNIVIQDPDDASQGGPLGASELIWVTVSLLNGESGWLDDADPLTPAGDVLLFNGTLAQVNAWLAGVAYYPEPPHSPPFMGVAQVQVDIHDAAFTGGVISGVSLIGVGVDHLGNPAPSVPGHEMAAFEPRNWEPPQSELMAIGETGSAIVWTSADEETDKEELEESGRTWVWQPQETHQPDASDAYAAGEFDEAGYIDAGAGADGEVYDSVGVLSGAQAGGEAGRGAAGLADSPVDFDAFAGAGSVVGANAAALAQRGRAVAVFNMAEITAMDLMSMVRGDQGPQGAAAAASLPSFLSESAPAPPFGAEERAAYNAERAEAAMWENVNKGLPSCTTCDELVEQAVKVFW